MGRKTVSGDIHHADIHGPQGYSLLENARAFVDQRHYTAIHNLSGRYGALWDAGLSCPLPYQRLQIRIGRSAPPFVVTIPPRQCLLSKATHVTEAIFYQGLSKSGFLQVSIFFANA